MLAWSHLDNEQDVVDDISTDIASLRFVVAVRPLRCLDARYSILLSSEILLLVVVVSLHLLCPCFSSAVSR